MHTAIANNALRCEFYKLPRNYDWFYRFVHSFQGNWLFLRFFHQAENRSKQKGPQQQYRTKKKLTVKLGLAFQQDKHNGYRGPSQLVLHTVCESRVVNSILH